MQMTVRADYFRRGDEPEILTLSGLEYGVNVPDTNIENFHWRYRDNPCGEAAISVVREDSSQNVVGFVWLIPLHMQMFGQKKLGAHMTNLLIKPEFRNGLAYAKLIRHRERAIAERNISLHYSFPVESHFERVNGKSGTSHYKVPLLVRPLNMSLLAKAALPQSLSQFLVGTCGTVAAPLVFLDRTKASRKQPIQVEWLDQFDDRFDGFWERVKDKYDIMAVRNRHFLAWRFAPVLNRSYRILAATSGEELVGYCVLRCTDDIRGIHTGLIMDMLFESGPRGITGGILLLKQAWQYFKEENVCLAGGLALSHTDEYAIMKRAGYLPCPDRVAPKIFRVLYKTCNDSIPDTQSIQADHWFITNADYFEH